MLLIDADRLCCSVVWRGSFAISSEDELARHHVVAGVEALGAPLAFPTSCLEAPRASPRTATSRREGRGVITAGG